MKLSSVEADLCATESPNHGDTGWLPPLEAKCNWSPDRRCHLVPDEGDVTSPWDFKLSNDPGTQHWKNALGADLARSLEAAGNFHMRLSWKKNLDACLVVFEAWSDTDNDGYFHAEVGAVLRDSTGDILKSTKALVSQRPGKPGRLPKTRTPGPPPPMTLDIFTPDSDGRDLLDRYIAGDLDGASFPEPLESYRDWIRSAAAP